MPCDACREFLMQLNKDNRDMEILTDYETRTTVKLVDVLPNWWGDKRYHNKWKYYQRKCEINGIWSKILL